MKGMRKVSIEQLPLEIKKCFLRELEKLVNKYSPFNNYSDETIKVAISILERVGNSTIGEIDADYLLEVLEMLSQYSEQVVEYHIWHNKNLIDPISLEEAKEQIEEININGFTLIENYVIYTNEDNRQMKRELAEKVLTDVYQIDRLFDKEELIEMWLNGTSQEDTIKDLIKLGLEELLEEPPTEAYISCDGTSIYYASIE